MHQSTTLFLRSVHQSTMLFFACASDFSASIHTLFFALSASIHNAVLCVHGLHQSTTLFFALSASNPQCCSLRTALRASIHNAVLYAQCINPQCSFLREWRPCINPQCCSYAFSASTNPNAVLCVHGAQCIHNAVLLRSVHQSTMLFFACALVSVHNVVLALSASIHNAVLCARCINPQCCSACARSSSASIHNAVLALSAIHNVVRASEALCINPLMLFFALSASIHNNVVPSVHAALRASIHNAVLCAQCINAVLCVQSSSVHQSTMLFFALCASIHNAVLRCTALRINPQRCSLRSVHQSTMLFFACTALRAWGPT
jgi:hypothetical protein